MTNDDRVEVAELFARLGRVLDEARFDDLGTIYAEDVLVRSPRGGELRGIDDVTAFVKNSHVEGDRTQHVHGDVLVEVDGDHAKATANQLAYFYRDGRPPHRTAGLWLDYTAVRTPVGWRVSEARLNRAWIRED